MRRQMQDFYKRPAPSLKMVYRQPCRYYFSHYEESYDGDLILINARIRERFKYFTDSELWKVCFGGLRLDRFEVERQGLRIEIVAKMRDIKEIREDIEEDKRIDMENKKIGEKIKRRRDVNVKFVEDINDKAKLYELVNGGGDKYWCIAEMDSRGNWYEAMSTIEKAGEPEKMIAAYKEMGL